MSKSKNLTKKWFAFMTISAFISVISFFHINSYVGDKYKLNTAFLITGIAVALIACYCLVKVIEYGGTRDFDK